MTDFKNPIYTDKKPDEQEYNWTSLDEINDAIYNQFWDDWSREQAFEGDHYNKHYFPHISVYFLSGSLDAQPNFFYRLYNCNANQINLNPNTILWIENSYVDNITGNGGYVILSNSVVKDIVEVTDSNFVIRDNSSFDESSQEPVFRNLENCSIVFINVNSYLNQRGYFKNCRNCSVSYVNSQIGCDAPQGVIMESLEDSFINSLSSKIYTEGGSGCTQTIPTTIFKGFKKSSVNLLNTKLKNPEWKSGFCVEFEDTSITDIQPDNTTHSAFFTGERLGIGSVGGTYENCDCVHFNCKDSSFACVRTHITGQPGDGSCLDDSKSDKTRGVFIGCKVDFKDNAAPHFKFKNNIVKFVDCQIEHVFPQPYFKSIENSDVKIIDSEIKHDSPEPLFKEFNKSKSLLLNTQEKTTVHKFCNQSEESYFELNNSKVEVDGGLETFHENKKLRINSISSELINKNKEIVKELEQISQIKSSFSKWLSESEVMFKDMKDTSFVSFNSDYISQAKENFLNIEKSYFDFTRDNIIAETENCFKNIKESIFYFKDSSVYSKEKIDFENLEQVRMNFEKSILYGKENNFKNMTSSLVRTVKTAISSDNTNFENLNDSYVQEEMSLTTSNEKNNFSELEKIKINILKSKLFSKLDNIKNGNGVTLLSSMSEISTEQKNIFNIDILDGFIDTTNIQANDNNFDTIKNVNLSFSNSKILTQKDSFKDVENGKLSFVKTEVNSKENNFDSFREISLDSFNSIFNGKNNFISLNSVYSNFYNSQISSQEQCLFNINSSSFIFNLSDIATKEFLSDFYSFVLVTDKSFFNIENFIINNGYRFNSKLIQSSFVCNEDMINQVERISLKSSNTDFKTKRFINNSKVVNIEIDKGSLNLEEDVFNRIESANLKISNNYITSKDSLIKDSKNIVLFDDNSFIKTEKTNVLDTTNLLKFDWLSYSLINSDFIQGENIFNNIIASNIIANGSLFKGENFIIDGILSNLKSKRLSPLKESYINFRNSSLNGFNGVFSLKDSIIKTNNIIATGSNSFLVVDGNCHVELTNSIIKNNHIFTGKVKTIYLNNVEGNTFKLTADSFYCLSSSLKSGDLKVYDINITKSKFENVTFSSSYLKAIKSSAASFKGTSNFVIAYDHSFSGFRLREGLFFVTPNNLVHSGILFSGYSSFFNEIYGNYNKFIHGLYTIEIEEKMVVKDTIVVNLIDPSHCTLK